LLRMLFGLSVGGELPGAMVVLSESAPDRHRCFYSSFAIAGISLGLLLGSLVSLIVFHSFNTQQVLAYGWRLAYAFGALVALIAFVLRYYGEDQHVTIDKLVQSPIVDSFVKFKRDIVKAMSIQLLPAVGFQFVFIYPLSFLKQYRHWPSSWMAALSVVLLTAFFFLVIFCSLLSDRFGRKRIAVIALILMLILAYPLMEMMLVHNFVWMTVACLVLCFLMSLYYGGVTALTVGIFKTDLKYTPVAIAHSLVFSLFAGSSLLVFASLIHMTGQLQSPVYYFILAIIVSLVGLLTIRE